MRRLTVHVVPVVVALAIGWHLAPAPPPEVRTTPQTPVEILDSLSRLEGEVRTLRGRLRGLTAAPEVATRTDTVLVPVPDTVLAVVTVTPDEVLTVTTVEIDSLPGMAAPTASVFALPGDCDDGLVVSPTGVVCDSAVLGHLRFFAGVSFGAHGESPLSLGLGWRPSYRSPWAVDAELVNVADGLRASIQVRWTFWELF